MHRRKNFDDPKNLFFRLKKKFSDRTFILYLFVCVIFLLLLSRLFFMQIINGEKYLSELGENIVKKIEIKAPRGNIYDRFGRIIAKNKLVYNIKLDTGIKINDLNQSLYALIKLLEKNNEEYVDTLPISKSNPFEFNFSSDSEKKRWQEDMNLDKNLNAEQVINYLCDFFDVDKNLDVLEKRKIIALRAELYKNRYRQYTPLVLALNVSDKTVIDIEEESDKFQGIYVEKEYIRDYVDAKCCANLIGYVGLINEKELNDLNEKENNYQVSDIVGKTGLEKSFEKELQGKAGALFVQVNSMGKRVGVVNKKNYEAGNNLFLSIDFDLQKKVYELIENNLKDLMLAKIKSGKININDLFASMIKNNVLSVKKIFDDKNIYGHKLKNFVLKQDGNLNYLNLDDQKKIRQIIFDGLKKNNISLKLILYIMREQGIISGDDNYFIKSTASKIFYDKIESGEIRVDFFNFDPCTASAIVLDVDNGDVLAAVNYPSYDSNKLLGNQANEYFNKILFAANTPMVNRVFMEPRAPGSTFKMITALTGLEKGVIDVNTNIYDELSFKKAGRPYCKCWARSSHGNLDVAHALEVSCNYFFCETAYRLGNSRNNNLLDGISDLNYYMRGFGLDDRTGVEIGELYDFSEPGVSNISSPDYKSKVKNIWYDGDTVRTAIGQAKNNYTAANMAKYINTLASGGKRFKLNLAKKLIDCKDNLVKDFEPVLEKELNLKPKNLDAVYKGMLLVTGGNRGTGRAVFKDFGIKVAGKTGTAQENNNRPDHVSFGGFAPFEEPRIAVYVLVPFGDTKLMSAPASKIAREIINYYFKLDFEKKFDNSGDCLVE